MEDLSSRVYKLIGENKKKTGVRMEHRGVCSGVAVDNITLRKEKPQPFLGEEFPAGLNDYFGDLCNDENYVKPVPLRVNPETHSLPELQ